MFDAEAKEEIYSQATMKKLLKRLFPDLIKKEKYRQILLKEQGKDCPSEDSLLDFITGYGLTDKEHAEILKHIRGCLACAEKVAAFRYFMCPGDDEIPEPEGYLESLLQRLRDTPRKVQYKEK